MVCYAGDILGSCGCDIAMKFIKALSEVEVLTLRTAQRDGPTPRMRQRALGVLLSSQGLRITQVESTGVV